MIERIGSRWYLIVLSVVFCVGAVMVINYSQPTVYAGRATLIKVVTSSAGNANKKALLEMLYTVASGSQVLEDALDAVTGRYSSYTPEDIMRAMDIRPVEGKYAVSVDAHLPNAGDSWNAADAVAKSTKKVWEARYGPKGGAADCSLSLTHKGQAALIELRFPPTSKTPTRIGKPASLATFARTAASATVLEDACRTLQDLGSNYTPQELRAATTIEQVRDSNVLSVEVTMPDATESKKVAGVVALCVKRAYKAQCGGGSSLNTVDAAYVCRVDQRGLHRRGLVRAFGAGLAVGIVLAALLPTAGRR